MEEVQLLLQADQILDLEALLQQLETKNLRQNLMNKEDLELQVLPQEPRVLNLSHHGLIPKLLHQEVPLEKIAEGFLNLIREHNKLNHKLIGLELKHRLL